MTGHPLIFGRKPVHQGFRGQNVVRV